MIRVRIVLDPRMITMYLRHATHTSLVDLRLASGSQLTCSIWQVVPSTGTKYLNKFSHAREQPAAWFNHEATCSQRHRHPSTNSTTVLSPCLSLPSRHGVQRQPGWVDMVTCSLANQSHRHALTHAPTRTYTHTHTHTHIFISPLGYYPHNRSILERDIQ